MALTVPQLQFKLNAIRTARDSGVLMIRHGDTHTTYRSLAEMDSIIEGLESDLRALQNPQRKRIAYIRQETKGFDGPNDGILRDPGKDWT